MFNIETLQSKSNTDLGKITQDLGVKVAKNSTENDKIFRPLIPEWQKIITTLPKLL